MILCAVALPVRLWVIESKNTDKVFTDGITYMQLGVNLKDGLGYVGGYKGEDGPYFFREPGYPALVAASLIGYEWLTGDEVGVPKNWRTGGNRLNPRMREVVQIVKRVQVVLDTGNVLLFFLTLLLVFRPSAAFALALCHAAYPPHAWACASIMHEVLETSLVLGLGYVFARFLLSNRLRWMIATGILLGLCILTL